ALLFAVVRDARDIRMMQLRRCARFPQEPRSHRRALRLLSIDHLERDDRAQDRIASAISNSHRTRAKLDRKAVLADLDFKMSVTQRTRHQSTACPAFCSRRLISWRKHYAHQATQALSVRPQPGQRSPASL